MNIAQNINRAKLGAAERMVINKIWNIIWDALRDLVPLVQFKKREKHPWRSVTFSKNAGWSLQLK